jgi:hypothetical protein
MNYIDAINAAKTHNEIDAIVEAAALANNCELDSSLSYAEQADFYESEADAGRNHDDAASLKSMAGILRAAEARWFAVEQ